MMIRTPVPQTHLLVPQEDHPQTLEFDLRLKEHECVSLVKKCRTIKEFRQVHGQILKLGLFRNSFCSTNLVTTCALSDWGSMEYATSIFGQIDEPSPFIFNIMIRGHVKSMNLEETLLMYTFMLDGGVQPDNFTYPALMKACALIPALQEGMQIHGHIFKLGLEDDEFVKNSLINMYGKCGKVRDSCAVFELMNQNTIVSWSALIAAHASMGLWSEGLGLFGKMSREGGRRANEGILVSVLSACTHLGALDLGRCTHGSLLRNMSGLNIIVETSLIDMYVKCGALEKGLFLFRRMAKKNLLSYNVIVSGLGMHGRGVEALNVFSEMLEEGFEPDDVIYVGVLSACSRAGMVEEGLRFFERMKCEHGIEPTIQHYGCMVDLTGRAGMLDRAFELINSMPMEPNDVLWRCLLNACRVHHDIELGEIAAKRLLQLNSDTASDYLVLSNMYAKARKWHHVAMARTKMARKGLTQVPGFSQVEVKRKIYKFVSQDMSQPHCDLTYEMLHQMEWQLKFEGYVPDTSQVLLDVDEEEKRERLSRHCQKLAIAFALIHTSHGSPIRIASNTRMCSDCHTYTKLVSVIYDRKITVRERNQFHHFKDGTCSCRDYW